MTTARRDFIKAAAGGALAVGLGGRPMSASGPPSRSPQAARQLNILILGGTTFLGPHQIRYALERGHSITTFTRGKTKPTIHKELFSDVEHLIGDRNDNLEALKGRTWDVVIDNSGMRVEWARDTAQLMKDSAELYVYTSSTGVYLPYLGENITEDRELVLADDPPQERPSYGVMKSLSEMEVRSAFGEDRSIVVRPTYIIGPADPLDRFTYWPLRLSRGGEVLVPGRGHDPIQYIDVRDLTEWMVRLAENRTAGTFNVVGPASPLGMHPFVYGVHAAVSSAVSWIHIPDYDFLKQHKVQYVIPWIMPVDDYSGSARISNARAVANGLTYRPLAQSSVDVLEWWHSDAVTDERRQKAWSEPPALTPDHEKEIIAAWRARTG